MAKLTVLVVGASGYLGGRLALSLEKSGWSVRYGVSRITGRDFPFKPVLTDLSDAKLLVKACKGVDAVVHVAGSDQATAFKDEVQAKRTDVEGTRKLLEAAERNGAGRFIYISTAHVYGDLEGEVTEESPTHPKHAYARLRLEAEELVRERKRVVVRLSNGFGPPVHEHITQWHLVVNDLCRSAVTGKKMILRSDGSQRRDFIPITDIGAAVNHLLETGEHGTFNLGGEWTISTKEVAEWIAKRVEKRLGFRPELQVGKPVGEKNTNFSYSIKKLLATGFHPTRDRDGEIDALIAFCADRFGKNLGLAGGA